MYFPGELGEIIPRKETLEVPAGDFKMGPSCPGRYY